MRHTKMPQLLRLLDQQARPAKNFSVLRDMVFLESLLGDLLEEEAMGGWHGQSLSQMRILYTPIRLVSYCLKWRADKQHVRTPYTLETLSEPH